MVRLGQVERGYFESQDQVFKWLGQVRLREAIQKTMTPKLILQMLLQKKIICKPDSKEMVRLGQVKRGYFESQDQVLNGQVRSG